MANIEPNQYVAYDKWCRRNGSKPTPLQMAQVDRLKELDEMCKKCRMFSDDQMKCEGTRLIFRPEQTSEPHLQRLVMESCHKLDARVTCDSMEKRLLRAGLPPRLVSEVSKSEPIRSNAVVICKKGDLHFNGHKLNVLSYQPYDSMIRDKVKAYIIAMATYGFQGIYLLTHEFYKSWVEGASRIDNFKNVQGPLVDCDWLVVDSIDFSNESTYFREALFNVARTRAAQLKPLTLIQANHSPQWQSAVEREFFQEATQWPKLSLP